MEFIEYDVVCRIDGCENLDIAIRVPALIDNPYIVCGVCGNKIEDVTEVG